jgi:hypothetical protein
MINILNIFYLGDKLNDIVGDRIFRDRKKRKCDLSHLLCILLFKF